MAPVSASAPAAFLPTARELEALKRLEQSVAHIDTGLDASPPERLVSLGFVHDKAGGAPALTARGLALVRRHT